MSIGYACLFIGDPETQLSTCVVKTATPEKLREIIGKNIAALERMITLNARRGIRLFRISSDVIPLATHPVNTLDWRNEFEEALTRTGALIRASGMRVSMHPGQYTVINSPSQEIVDKSVADLSYHADFLDALGVDASHKLILHVGGMYGDRKAALGRFAAQVPLLPEKVRRRLVIENDDKLFTVEDCLSLSAATGLPVVFDNLHHALNPSQEKLTDAAWIVRCGLTWREEDGRQKTHYSQQQPGAKVGSHSQTIDHRVFCDYYQSLAEPRPDVMLEVKDKNLSAVKCTLVVAESVPVRLLEEEWARYKYLILSKSQRHYNKLRLLLKDKGNHSLAMEFYDIVADAMALEEDRGAWVNAAQHMWGHVSDAMTEAEHRRFRKLTDAYACGEGRIGPVINHIRKCALACQEPYLCQSLALWHMN